MEIGNKNFVISLFTVIKRTIYGNDQSESTFLEVDQDAYKFL